MYGNSLDQRKKWAITVSCFNRIYFVLIPSYTELPCFNNGQITKGKNRILTKWDRVGKV